MEKSINAERTRMKGSRRFVSQGVELLRTEFDLPRAGEEGVTEGIGNFYRRLGEAAIGFCEGRLLAEAEEAYGNSQDPRKRFCTPYFTYRLRGDLSLLNGLLSVRLSATLVRKDGAPTLRWVDGQVWELTDPPRLLPPREAAERLLGRTLPLLVRGMDQRKGGLYIREGRVFYTCGGGERELFIGGKEGDEGRKRGEIWAK